MQGRLESQLQTEKKINSMLETLPKYVSDYYFILSSAKREPKSCLSYINGVSRFLHYMNENVNEIDITSIDDTDVARYLKSLEITTKNGQLKETSFSFRKTNHTILNSFFTYLYKKGTIARNPMELIERETAKDDVKRKFLTEDELREIIDTVHKGAGSSRMINKQKKFRDRDIAIFMLFIQTGMRETALREINVSDVNFGTSKITLIEKGHKHKEIIFGRELADSLRSWLETREEIISEYKEQGKEVNEDALFITEQRSRISASAIQRLVKKYIKEAIGVEVSPHKLRAAYANILLNKTGNLHFVSKMMGHARPDTTQIYLSDNSDEDKERAAELISATIFR